MGHPNEQRFRDGYAAFQRGDMDALRNEFLTSDVVWHAEGRNPIAGTYKGIDEVLMAFGKTFELSGGTFSIEIHDCLANDEHGVVLGVARGDRDGKHLEDKYAHVVHFRDGKVAESWLHVGDQYATDEFWS